MTRASTTNAPSWFLARLAGGSDRRDGALARRWRDELASLTGDGLDELPAAARRRHRGAPHANWMMVDAC